MRGHQQSNMRKLNRHWQSGGGSGDWKDFNVWLSNAPDASHNNVAFFYNNTGTGQNAGNPTLAQVREMPHNVPTQPPVPYFYKLPASGKIIVKCYAKLLRFNDPSIIDVGSRNWNNALHFGIDWTDNRTYYNSNLQGNRLLAYSFDTVNTNLTVKNGVYMNYDLSGSTVINNFECISKDKNNPTIFEYDLGSVQPTAQYFYIFRPIYQITAVIPANQSSNGIIYNSANREDRSEIDIFYKVDAEVVSNV